MSTMVVELYEALKEAGASEEKAKAAAVAMANIDDRFNRIDAKLAAIDAELQIVKWVSGAVLAGIVALVLKAFWPH